MPRNGAAAKSTAAKKAAAKKAAQEAVLKARAQVRQAARSKAAGADPVRPPGARTSGSGPIAAATSAVTALLSDAPAAEVEQILAAARGGDQELESALWGAAPGRIEATASSIANLRAQFSRRRLLEQESVTRTEAAELLGTSEQAVTDALEARRIVGFKRGRRWLLPAWQFEADTEQGVVPGLDKLTDAFPGGVVALSMWVTRPAPDLDGRPPRALLAAGEVSRVVQLARALTAAAW